MAVLKDKGLISREEEVLVLAQARDTARDATKLPAGVRSRAWSYLIRLSKRQPMKLNKAIVYLATEHRGAFEQHYHEWQRDRGIKDYARNPEDQLEDGRLVYPRVSDEFLDVLRRKGVPFSLKET
jgi:hypothetical protein